MARRDWAGNKLDNDVIYCGTFTGGKIKVYRNLDKATANSIMRHIVKQEKRVDKYFRGMQLLTADGKDFRA